MTDDFEPLTDAQVQAGARPGESWEAARCRLEEARQVGTDTGGIIVSDRSPYASLTIRPEQLDAVKSYQQLSSREQFEHWGFCPERLAAIERDNAKPTKGTPAMLDPTTDPVMRMQDIAADSPEWPAVDAGYAFVAAMAAHAEKFEGLPRWPGYALRAAFGAGAQWQREQDAAAATATESN